MGCCLLLVVMTNVERVSNDSGVTIGVNRDIDTDTDPLTGYRAWMVGRGLSGETVSLRLGYLHRVPGRDGASTTELLLWMGGHRWMLSTRSSVLSVLAGYYGWLRRRGYRDDDPTEAIERIRPPAPMPRPTPTDVVEAAMLTGTDRLRLMVALGAGAGLRRSEIAAVQWSHRAGGALQVLGKGAKLRRVTISPLLDAVLDAELRRRLGGAAGTGFGPVDLRSRFVFPGADRGHISPKTVGRDLSAALGPGWTGHTLRHRFATLAYAGSGHDVFQVQQLLGHSSPAVTARYVALDPCDAAAAVAAAAVGLGLVPAYS